MDSGGIQDAGSKDNFPNFFSLELKAVFHSKLLPVLITFIGFIAMSPVLAHFGWRGVTLLAIALVIPLTLLLLSAVSLKIWFVCVTVLILMTSTVTGIFWEDVRYVFANIFLIGVLFLLQFSTKQVVHAAVNIASVVLLVIVSGAVIGFLWAYLGLQALWEFPRPGDDTQIIRLFFSTLTNAWWGNVIRPAGIYDEPGALSLYICSLAATRHLLGKSNRLTWSLLTLGLVTLSLAHVVYLVFHLLAERATKTNVKTFFFIIIAFIVVAYSSGFNLILKENLAQRFTVSEGTYLIQGDNRSYRMFNAIEIIKNDTSILFFGADPSCRFEYEYCQRLFPPIGENPLTPLFTNGLFITWPFYISLFFLLISPLFGRVYVVSFGFGLLLLQRPEMLSFSGAMISTMVVLITLAKISHNFKMRREYSVSNRTQAMNS